MDSRAFCIGLGALVGYVLSPDKTMGLLVGAGLGYVLCTSGSGSTTYLIEPGYRGYGWGAYGWGGGWRHRERPHRR